MILHLMKHLLTCTGLAAIVALAVNPTPAFAQGAPTAPPAAKAGQPKAQFSETTFDFGKIKPTDTAKHDFIVTNTGDATLEITAVQPGCGCTTAGAWDRLIEPGKTGKIPIQFNPGSFSGPVSKGVSVTSTDPTAPSQYLVITAAIWRPIEVTPQSAYFMPVIGEETNETKIIRIVNHTDEHLTLEPPQSGSLLFKTEIKTVKPDKEFELHISYNGPVSNAPPQGNISIKTSSAGTPVINVNAVAMTQPAIATFPSPILLPPVPLKSEFSQAVTVRNNSRTPLQVSDAAINAEGAKVRVQEIDPGKVALLTLIFPAGFQPKAGQQLDLTFNTTHPKHPVVHVPVTQPAPIAPPPNSASTGGGK